VYDCQTEGGANCSTFLLGSATGSVFPFPGTSCQISKDAVLLRGRPGRSGASRPLSPLRTVHDTFASHRSSISKGEPLWGHPLMRTDLTDFAIHTDSHNAFRGKAHTLAEAVLICFPSLMWFAQLSRNETPAGRLLPFGPGKS